MKLLGAIGRYERNKGPRYEQSKDASFGAPGLTTNGTRISAFVWDSELRLFALFFLLI